MTVGQRAAMAIKRRAASVGVSPEKIMIDMGSCRKTLNDWDRRDLNPSAYWLQQLALNGYDVYWILTGEESYTGPYIDFDLADHEEEI